MSITSNEELSGMQKVSEAVAVVLKAMREHCQPGMSAKELDDFGGVMLTEMGAKSAPKLTYDFPGHTCISVNHEVAHGIPSADKILKNGDLINIDVSAELDGFWADNGGSFVLGEDINNHLPLVKASKQILQAAISQIKGGVKIADIGMLIEKQAAKRGFKVIKNLAGHGVGRSLHEEPHEILNCYDRDNKTRFRKNSIVAIETFIATHSTYANEGADEWTLTGNKGGYVAQHEHTIMVTDGVPVILTKENGIY
ncbi:type I methionyl aminopeptidase [Mucilaginibacter polytrichastri]|uniref:Methionine aminopeptidase n=1 Tax=Mucilaginibacter polytrichastri TaxID=1302689 RepID=A0A1Q6A1Y1_9SPHI|nr:type I methionyl aminopeptidase [Mucilaginibacter polytrichastri]OKS88026.1 Methionine aminopeptidase 2 [Mucilaginibacter polytrichastri]SFT10421.1 methionine aminopeptidase, type I [Mucilaginibacter polytrichastri]